VRHWGEEFGRDESIRQSLHRLVNAPTVLNVRHVRAPVAEEGLLPHEGPHVAHHRVWTGPHSALGALLDARRDIWVQDSSSARTIPEAARVIGSPPGGVILDLCAGQGTKTRQLAACFPEATIFATDTDSRRVAVLRNATAHLARVRVLEIGELASRMGSRPGLILLDVPCSNSGVLARRVEAALRWSESQTARLVALQRQILRQARELLAPGGMILYSTCSMDSAENQHQVAWAADELSLDLLAQEATLPAGLPGEDPAAYSDGAFWAVLRAGGTRRPRAGVGSHSAPAGGVHSGQLPTLPGGVLPEHRSKEPTA
jgi:16S rRNA C967 or C1407 C5-methylase (RsmB/RsmF family)